MIGGLNVVLLHLVGMEAVEGMLERMKLVEVERKGIRVEVSVMKAGSGDPQAVGKVLAEKLVSEEGLK